MKVLKRLLPTPREVAVNKWRYLAIIFSGLILRFAFSRFDLWWLVWIAPVPFFYFLFNCSPRIAFWSGWLFGFSFYYATIFWLNTLSLYNPFTLPGIFLLGLAMGLFVAVFALCNSRFESRIPHLRWFYTPGLWAIFEYLRSLGAFGFAWAYFAHTHYQQLEFIQLADITGVYGISFLIVLGNITLAEIIYFFLHRKELTRAAKLPLKTLAIFGFLIVANLLYGHWAIKRHKNLKDGFRIGIVQPNVPQPMKLASYASPDQEEQRRLQLQMLEELAELVLSLKGRCELIVCPETAVSDPFFAINEPLKEFMKKLAQEAQTPILFGADYSIVSFEKQAVEKMYNSAWLVEPDKGFASEIYHKIHLVPFGEYVPLGGLIPFLQETIVQIGNFDAGKESTIFRLKGNKLRFGVMICFESSFSYLAQRLVKGGANFLVVITNDAWYGRSSGAYQHFALAVFRAIEFRRPVVRSANTGISALISPTGEIIKSLSLETKGILQSEIYPTATKTFCQNFGDLFVYLLIALLLLSQFIIKKSRKTPNCFVANITKPNLL